MHEEEPRGFPPATHSCAPLRTEDHDHGARVVPVHVEFHSSPATAVRQCEGPGTPRERLRRRRGAATAMTDGWLGAAGFAEDRTSARHRSGAMCSAVPPAETRFHHPRGRDTWKFGDGQKHHAPPVTFRPHRVRCRAEKFEDNETLNRTREIRNIAKTSLVTNIKRNRISQNIRTTLGFVSQTY